MLGLPRNWWVLAAFTHVLGKAEQERGEWVVKRLLTSQLQLRAGLNQRIRES